MSLQPRQMLPLREFDDAEDETGRLEGARYRFDHLSLPMVMNDMRFASTPDGMILFRAQWANDTDALAAALDAAVTGRAPHRSQSGGLFKPTLRMLRNIAPVLDRAGAGAWADRWFVAPPPAWMAFLTKLFRLRPSHAAPVGPSAASTRATRG